MTDLEISNAIRHHENNLSTWRFLESRGKNCAGAIAYDLERIAHYKAITPQPVKVFH